MFDSLMPKKGSSTMKILVTGGAGFIGSNFVRRSLDLKSNLQITVLDCLTYSGRLSNLEGLLDKITFVEGNILDKPLVEKLVSETDLVVHFAAESHNDNSLVDPEPFIQTNVVGTFDLIQTAAKHGKRFHHVSTDEVFGELPLEGKERFTPDTAYNPSSPYSASKAASDHLVRAWVRSFGLKATISNCSNNYGPFQHEEKLIPRTILLVSAGIKPKVYGSGANVRDWIFVDDHTDGIWAVLDKGRIGQTYLLGSDNQRSNVDVVRSILAVMDKPEDFMEFVEDRPGHDLRYAIDASRTISELGWKPKENSFEDHLPQLVDFYRRLEVNLDKISHSGLSNRASKK
jgi:dTDP-glucose 4,6-dehydratase